MKGSNTVKVKISVWGYGSIWNLDVVKTAKEMEKIEAQIEDGSWDYEKFGEPDMPFDGGVKIEPACATIAVDDSEGKTIFESNVSDLPWVCFDNSYESLAKSVKLSKRIKQCVGFWLYKETAKGEFFSLEGVELPKEGFNPKKLCISLKRVLCGETEVLCYIDEVSYNDDILIEEPDVDFKGGGSLETFVLN